MPYLDRHGVRIFYESSGAGPPVLLSHGFSATSQMWRSQVEVLAPDHQVIVWDMRGHGQSDSPDDPSLYSEAATVDDMASILDACEVDRAVVGGLSLGGYMSLAFSQAHPDRVEALMLFDTGPGYRNDAGRDEWNAMAEQRATAFESQGLASLGRGAEVRASTHRSATGLALAARGMLAQRDAAVMDALPGIKVPTLVLVGADDQGFLASADYMAAKIPGATKVVIPSAGHAANLDQPDQFNKHVADFLATVGW